MAELIPPIRPWKSQSRGNSEGVNDQQKKNAANAMPVKSSLRSPHAHSVKRLSSFSRGAGTASRRWCSCGWLSEEVSSPESTIYHPNSAGSVPSKASRSLAIVTEKCPWTSTESLPSSTTPIRVHGKPRAVHIPVKRVSSVRGTATRTRPDDSENKVTNGSAPSGIRMRQPVSPASAASTTAWASPPSERSWAAVTRPSRDEASRMSASSCSRARSTFGGTPPR